MRPRNPPDGGYPGELMPPRKEKHLVLIGIRRKGQKGFTIKSEVPRPKR